MNAAEACAGTAANGVPTARADAAGFISRVTRFRECSSTTFDPPFRPSRVKPLAMPLMVSTPMQAHCGTEKSTFPVS